MTTEPLPAPGRVSALTTGHYYQWLLAWQGCVVMLREQALRKPNFMVAVGVEADGVGNLDDIVYWRQQPPHSYHQAKYAVDSSTPVNFEYLTELSKSGGPSILRKLADAHRRVTQGDIPADLVLVTNKAPDRSDVLIAGRDSRTKLLLPGATARRDIKNRRQARADWATAAGVTEKELLRLLSVLRFDLAKDLPDVEHTISLLMQVAGLRGDPKAVEDGAKWVEKQVREGRKRLDLDMVQEAVKILDLKQGPPRAVLSIATLKPDPLADQAAHQLDWFDRLEGADAFAKRRPAAPATWAQLQHDIDNVPHRLGAVSQVAVTGSLRQATAFALGAALRMVTNIDLAVTQRDQLWTSSEDYDIPIEPVVVEHHLGQGDEIAFAVEAATKLTGDVLAYLRDEDVPIAKLVVVRPPTGPKDRSIPDAGFANAFAVGVRDQARQSARGHSRLHLFMAGPMGLALLLGHRWNRVTQTVVYEEVLAGTQYEPAFTIGA